eukprot:706792-Prorocentrum_minimum.AAC.1
MGLLHEAEHLQRLRVLFVAVFPHGPRHAHDALDRRLVLILRRNELRAVLRRDILRRIGQLPQLALHVPHQLVGVVCGNIRRNGVAWYIGTPIHLSQQEEGTARKGRKRSGQQVNQRRRRNPGFPGAVLCVFSAWPDGYRCVLMYSRVGIDG